MKVSDANPLRGPAATRRRPGAGGAPGSFDAYLDAASAENAAPAGAATPPPPVASVDGLLALQSMEGEAERRRQAVREGEEMLDSLERLRRSLLSGGVPPGVLRELEQRLSRQRAMVSDPQLIALIDDIELRVAVEKAKLDRALLLRGGEEA